MSTWMKIIGTQTGQFVLGLLGVRLKNNAGNLDVRNNADSAYADVTANKYNATGDTGLVINSDAAGSGDDWKLTINRAATGMTADVTLTLPVDDGTAGQVLQTDGSGVLSWTTVNTAATLTTDTTSFAFGSAATVSMFTLPANAVVDSVKVIVDTAFDGTPTLSVGVNGGSASQYVASGDTLLTVADRYDIPYQGVANGSTEALELYYAAGGATVGAGRVIVTYSVPA